MVGLTPSEQNGADVDRITDLHTVQINSDFFVTLSPAVQFNLITNNVQNTADTDAWALVFIDELTGTATATVADCETRKIHVHNRVIHRMEFTATVSTVSLPTSTLSNAVLPADE